MSAVTVDRLARYWAIRIVFMMEAMVIGAWLPRIPDIKHALQMDAGMLGVVLIGLPAGTFAGFVITAQFSERAGSRRACMISGPVFSVSLIGPGLAPTPAWLFTAFCRRVPGRADRGLREPFRYRADQPFQVTQHCAHSATHREFHGPAPIQFDAAWETANV